jgi:DNA topoisomerase VI subunit B
MLSFSVKAHHLAVEMALTWKDDAPLADAEILELARNRVALTIQDFENTLTKVLREVQTQEVKLENS